MLFGWQTSWSKVEAIIFVTASQMLCGIAKDLTKLGGKTVTKLITPDEKQSRLFKTVSLLTGWKNSMKGVGAWPGVLACPLRWWSSRWPLQAAVCATPAVGCPKLPVGCCSNACGRHLPSSRLRQNQPRSLQLCSC